MADDAAIRRKNLNRFMHAAGLKPSDMAVRFYGRVSYWSDLARDSAKPFGEKAARRLEEAAGLPRLWLDTPDAALEASEQMKFELRETAPNYPPPKWPWSAVLWAHVNQADDEQLAHAERILRAFFGLPDVSHSG